MGKKSWYIHIIVYEADTIKKEWVSLGTTERKRDYEEKWLRTGQTVTGLTDQKTQNVSLRVGWGWVSEKQTKSGLVCIWAPEGSGIQDAGYRRLDGSDPRFSLLPLEQTQGESLRFALQTDRIRQPQTWLRSQRSTSEKTGDWTKALPSSAPEHWQPSSIPTQQKTQRGLQQLFS